MAVPSGTLVLSTSSGNGMISGVSGTIGTGNILTISGIDLNAEDKTHWVDYFKTTYPTAWRFGGASKTADGYSVIGPDGGVYDSNVKLFGNQSIKFHVEGASGANPPNDNLGDYNSPWNTPPNPQWARYHVLFNAVNGVWPNNYCKMFYDVGQPNGHYAQLYMNGGAAPTHFLCYDPLSGIDSAFPLPAQVQNNRWYEIIVYWKYDSHPCAFKVWWDGEVIVDLTPSATNVIYVTEFGIINCSGTSANFSMDHWWGSLTLATAQLYPSCRIEIGNNQDYATATKIWQPPTFISDTSVSINQELTGLGTGSLWLWITNNAQTRSSAVKIR